MWINLISLIFLIVSTASGQAGELHPSTLQRERMDLATPEQPIKIHLRLINWWEDDYVVEVEGRFITPGRDAEGKFHFLSVADEVSVRWNQQIFPNRRLENGKQVKLIFALTQDPRSKRLVHTCTYLDGAEELSRDKHEHGFFRAKFFMGEELGDLQSPANLMKVGIPKPIPSPW